MQILIQVMISPMMFDTKYKEPETAAEIHNRALAIAMRHGRLPKPNYVSRAVVMKALPAPAPRLTLAQRDVIDVSKPFDIEKLDGRTVPLEVIIQTVCNICKVSNFELRSPRRSRYITDARKVYYHLARKLTALSLPSIGRHVGSKDHSTVCNGLKVVARNPEAFAGLLGACENRIKEIMGGMA